MSLAGTHGDLDVRGRTERTIFSLFFAMRNETNTHPRIRVVFYLLQLLQLFFAVCPIPPSFLAIGWIGTILRILEFSFSTSLTALIASVTACAAFSLGLLVDALAVALMLHRDSAALAWPLGALKGMAYFATTAGFVPLVGALFAPLDCTYVFATPTLASLGSVECWGLSEFGLVSPHSLLISALPYPPPPTVVQQQGRPTPLCQPSRSLGWYSSSFLLTPQ